MYDNNYFKFSMPAKTDEDMPMFNHNQYFMGASGFEDDPFNNLSLKLRGKLLIFHGSILALTFIISIFYLFSHLFLNEQKLG